jgi:purine-binding chemotaxis protein CheW
MSAFENIEPAACVGGAVVDSLNDLIELSGGQVMPVTQFNSAVDAGHIAGNGALKQGEHERMLILVDLLRLMTSAEMGPVDMARH